MDAGLLAGLLQAGKMPKSMERGQIKEQQEERAEGSQSGKILKGQ
jgi:hypothetical protein